MQSPYIPGVDGPMVPHPKGTLHGRELGQVAIDLFDGRTICPWPRIKGSGGMKSLQGVQRRNWIVRGSGIVPLAGAVCDRGVLFTADKIPVMGFSRDKFLRRYIIEGKVYRAGPGIARIAERSLVVFMSDTANYYHFIADVMPNLARAIGAAASLGVEQLVIYGAQPEGGFRRAYLDLMLARLTIPVRYEAGPFVVDDGYFIVHSPQGYARDPDTGALLNVPQPGPYPFPVSEGMWDFFDAFDHGHVSLPEPPIRAPILIVSRAHLDNRKIVNEDDLVASLAPLGARRVVLENYALPEQIAMVRAARVLVGCHGAGMINGGFLGQGGRVIEITARQYAARSRDFARLSHVRPIRYSFILADEHGERFRMKSNLGNNIIMSPQALAKAHEWASQTLAARAG